MKKYELLIMLIAGMLAISCGQKKKNDDIIVKRVETPKPQGPIRMQEYKQTKDIEWLHKDYQVEVRRVADDSLKMVKDENGQKFVDNRITIRIMRSDGSVFFNQTFTKAAFEKFLDDDYRQTGILEGLVFDRVDGPQLVFAASVSHPQTDEYVPMVVTVSNFGTVGIKPDTELDTSGSLPPTSGEEECGMWKVECGRWNVECGMRNVE